MNRPILPSFIKHYTGSEPTNQMVWYFAYKIVLKYAFQKYIVNIRHPMWRIPIYIASDGLSLSKHGWKRAVRRALPVFREWKTITSNMYRYKAHRVFYIYFIQHSRRLVVKFLLKTTVVMKKKFLWKTNNWPSYCEFPAGRSTALVNICVRFESTMSENSPTITLITNRI